uniref:Elongation of very long chain fatty acids protein n=1 Tax=Dermatophagoides pteronyssinus TaxID=6956 RepID=A0A6P6XW15_DERPT|nr:elongation of very long chain fatty acids protein 7-like isoform X2 [Dermatophagoides pteronyssinus]
METLRYYMFDFWEQESDKRISDYPLMKGGPWIAWSIVITYVYFVTSLGPKLMKNRQSMNLQWLIVTYNLLMILINGYFFYQIMIPYRFGIDIKIWDFQRTEQIDHSPRTMHICLLSYLYLISKYMDLAETIFFVLRKKFNQITSLHVYHHAIVPILVHMFIKVSPAGGPGAMFPLLNSFIHTIMYIYYTLSALGLRRYTWWKKYVTQLQLTQFVIFGIIQPVIFFAMFFSFYKRAYRLSSDKQQRQSKTMNIMDTIDTNTNNNNKMTNGSTKTIINADDEDNNRICQNGHINGNKTNGHIVVDNKKNE